MNETLKTLESRRGCKSYKPELIDDEKLEAILKAGTYAANGRGKQSPIIISVKNKAMRDKLCALNAKIMGMPDYDPFYGAPQLAIVLSDKSVATHVYDGALVIGNMMNAAASLGVGSRWIHRAKEEFETEEGKQILKDLGITGDYEGIGHLILGYPDGPMDEAAPRKDNYIYRID